MTDRSSEQGRSSDHDAIRKALASVQDFLDAWGGDPSRWPEHERSRIERLIATTPGASSLIAEARALDQLILSARDLPARLGPSKSRSLADRIISAASADDANSAGSNVVAFPSDKRRNSTHAPDLAREAAIAARRPWQAAGVLAASLLVGLVLGGSLNMAPVVQELAEVAGLSTAIDTGLGDDIGEDETL